MLNRNTLCLAALLHDIGKFWQRADDGSSHSSRFLSASIKQNEGLYCPQYNGKYSHKHVLWTAQFLEENKSFFQQATGNENFETFFKAAVMHHRPDPGDIAQMIVQKADHYSSGADRSEKSGSNDAQAENQWDSFKNVQMVSIFEGLKKGNIKHQYHVPIRPLACTEEYFPSIQPDREGQKSYAKLWEGFIKDFEQLKQTKGNAKSMIGNLSSLLHRYAATVPSSTIHLPDVSLFDHLKSTAVFSLCLFDYLEEKNRLSTPIEINATEAPILLVGGDLSGIQSYIYDIVSTDAARNLKGRSFYLQVLVENTVEYLLNKLNLPSLSVIYTSGGSFYLIAPNTDRAISQLQEVQKEISDIVFAQHKTNLTLNIAWQEVTQAQVFSQTEEVGIHKAWRELTQKIARAKSQKFKSRIENDYDFFFSPGELGGMQKTDFITGEEFPESDIKFVLAGKTSKNIEYLDGETSKPILKSTLAQINLGKKLRYTKYWVTSMKAIPHWESYLFQIDGMPVFNYFLSDDHLNRMEFKHLDDVVIRQLNLGNAGEVINKNYHQLLGVFRGGNSVYDFTFYGGNSYPEKPNKEPFTFEDMAKCGGGQNGTQKLGVLRMDVDNLGSIFISGLDNRQRTFSRYSALSRNLDFFFKGYLNTIWEEKYASSTSIIYSGGDDLFIVGYWEDVIRMAQTIREKFEEWVCKNPNLSISGGVVLTGAKFPISKGAKMAENEEDSAKEHKTILESKNAFSLFSIPLNWHTELPVVLELHQEMKSLLDNKEIPRGLLQKMMTYAEVASFQKKEKLNPAWRWQIAYDVARAKEKKSASAKKFYDEIKNAVLTDHWKGEYLNDRLSNYSFLDLLAVAARWTELVSKSNIYL